MKFFSGFLSSVLLHSATGGEDPVGLTLVQLHLMEVCLGAPRPSPACLTLLVPLQSLTFSKGSMGFPSQLCMMNFLHHLFYLEHFLYLEITFSLQCPFRPPACHVGNSTTLTMADQFLFFLSCPNELLSMRKNFHFQNKLTLRPSSEPLRRICTLPPASPAAFPPMQADL